MTEFDYKGLQDPRSENLPAAPAGFEHVNRYWDRQNEGYAAKITPGEFYVSTQREIITTILGSCIAACVWDKHTCVGGMNHFMLPRAGYSSSSSWQDSPVGMATRYGNVAMERLINAALANGATRKNLEVKIFGGAKVLNIDSDVGQTNIDFVLEYLKTEDYTLRALDVGGKYPRKVLFFPDSGRVRVKKLYSSHNQTLQQREKVYRMQLDTEIVEGEVTLFTD